MPTHRRRLVKKLFKLIWVVPSIINVMSHFLSLVAYEAKEAGKSFIMLMILSVFFAVILTSSWLILLALLFFYLSMHLGAPVSLSILLGINIFILLIMIFVMKRVKEKLFFPETSYQCHRLFSED